MFQMGKLRLWRYRALFIFKKKVKIVTRALCLDSLNSVLVCVCVCVCVCVHAYVHTCVRENSEGTKIDSGTSESLEALNFDL